MTISIIRNSLIALLLLLVSCTKNRLFDDMKSIPSEGWKANSNIVFDATVNDTSVAYDILLNVRNTASYEFSNLWLFIEISAPNGDTMIDTVEFKLADMNGKWLGSGLGTINSVLLPYKSNIQFPYRGIYTFEIQQAMRKDILHGIKDIGVRIEKHY